MFRVAFFVTPDFLHYGGMEALVQGAVCCRLRGAAHAGLTRMT